MTLENTDPIVQKAEQIRDRLLDAHEPTQTTEVPSSEYWDQLVDIRIAQKLPLLTPQEVAGAIPLTDSIARTALFGRGEIEDILVGESDRLLVIAGPCSIHSAEAAEHYADWLVSQREMFGDSLEIVMRAYMEKPRTELGWKGLMNDPKLDETFDLNLGVVLVRLLASKILDMGVPIAMERLNTRTPQYLNGLVSYDAIGARNTTDQNAREYASGSSSPVGFKNTPEGSIVAAVEAVKAARSPHVFPGTAADGRSMQVQTTGNPYTHVILRGSQTGPNYSSEYVQQVKELMEGKRLTPALLIDTSHGNSQKDYTKQPEVVEYVAEMLALGEAAIKGVMIESNIVAGSQRLADPSDLVYGQSITDGCIDLDTTEDMFNVLAESVYQRRKAVNGSSGPVSLV